MQLLQAIASGVKGAENGHVELYRRGTSTRATWYGDYKGSDGDATGANITLDGNGGAVIYVNEVVDVVVKNSSGTAVRSYTDMVGAAAVEVKSDSFTGVHYDTAVSAVNNPITLASLLNLWDDSASADDFKVSLDGTATNLSSIFGRLSGPAIHNVKDPLYGAEGDGATDDTTAIQAAIDAAEAATYGGVVYFPPGKYLTSAVLTVEGDVSLVGAGPNQVQIAMDHATNPTLKTATVASAYNHIVISGIRINPHQSNTGNLIQWAIANGEVLVDNCYIGGSNSKATALTTSTTSPQEIVYRNCTFNCGGETTDAIAAANNNTELLIDGCRFKTPATYNPTNAIISAGAVRISDCTFELGASTSGTFSCFKAVSTTLNGVITGCVFEDTGGATATGITLGTYVAASHFVESGNMFSDDSNFTAYSYTVAAASEGADVQLITRETRVKVMTDNSAALTIAGDQYGVIMLGRTNTTSQTITTPMPPLGARLVLTISADGANAPIQLDTTDFVGFSDGAVTVNSTTSTRANLICVLLQDGTEAVELLLNGPDHF